MPKPHMAQTAILLDADGREAERFVDSQTENGFVYEIGEAMRCIREGKLESAVVPHSATLRAAEYIRRIHESLR